MPQPSSPVELARQRDPKAIANLLNSRTMPLNTTTKISLKGDVLQLLLESSEEPDREKLLPIVQGFLVKLKIVGVERVRVYGRSQGQDVPAWTSEFEIIETQDPTPSPAVPQKKIQSFRLTGATPKTAPKTPQQEALTPLHLIGNSMANKNKVWRWIKARTPQEQAAMVLVVVVYLVVAANGLKAKWKNEASDYERADAPTKSVGASCQPAAGRLWSEVQLYADSGCKTPSSTVRGGGSGQVLILIPPGTLEWKARSAVGDSFVKTNDPAIAARRWVEIQPPN